MDIWTPQGLERAVHLATLAGETQEPASPEDLALLGKTIRFPIPNVVKSVLAISDGIVIDEDEVNLLSTAEIRQAWAFHAELIAESDGDDWEGYIGRDALPLTAQGDGDYLVWRRDEDGVFTHYPAEGSSDEPEFESLEHWFAWLVGCGIANALDDASGDTDVFDVVDAFQCIDGPPENRSFDVLDRVGKIVEDLLAGTIDAATAVERAKPHLVIED